MKTISITIPVPDAEPILREAARKAAYYSSLLDHITRRTYHPPRFRRIEDARKEWREAFLAAKRMVEAFGAEYEPVGEAETLTVSFPHTTGGTAKLIRLPGAGPVRWISGAKFDETRPEPTYRGDVHAEACRQAADRVVRRWRALLVERDAA